MYNISKPLFSRKNNMRIFLFICAFILLSEYAFSESEEPDYQGITDPFTDPTRYEFAEDEREDKEFFHLGRYLMFSIDAGIGVFTHELGRTTTSAFFGGLRLIYFFDKHIALDIAGGYGNHVETVYNSQSSTTELIEIETIIIPTTLGIRYYFDTKNSPRAIAIANPYLNFGAGVYTRIQNILQGQAQSGNTSSFGAYMGAGVQFPIYRRHIYLGLDAKYHLIFFVDENTGYLITPGDREGDYMTIGATITYNF